MDQNYVFEKTDTGVELLKTRSTILSQKHRRCLILMDGQRSAFDLSGYFRPGEFIPIVTELIERGYVVAPPGWVAEAEQQGPISDFPRIQKDQFIDILRRAVREISDRLGPAGDPLVMDLSRCDSPERLRSALRGAEQILEGFLGPEAAKEFVKRIGKELMG
jgi:hypothetical protein